MGTRKLPRWSWASFLAGGASAVAAAALLRAKPQDPTFHLISINLGSFKLNFPVLDADLTLTVHVTNPNIVPVHYSAATLSIYYDGSLLGSARVESGSQPARSCRLIRLPGRLDGLELAQHAKRFLNDVASREMVLDARVDVGGTAKVLWWWDHRFAVHVESKVTVDPLLLDVVDQENKSKIDLLPA
ncbi:unnamed protein product [Linum trigynum]|uniref:Water stress and hypersensitive response domain-containing protein n=1 Tax=Linum trigynum TaxID=586398 RepID=A0AAV2D6I5_9ROSI